MNRGEDEDVQKGEKFFLLIDNFRSEINVNVCGTSLDESHIFMTS
jgi:hypothetical protein